MEDKSDGVCKKLSDCSYRIKEVMSGKRNGATTTGRCGFVKNEEIVCCPGTRKGKEDDNDNNNNNNTITDFSPKISGRPSEEGQYLDIHLNFHK